MPLFNQNKQQQITKLQQQQIKYHPSINKGNLFQIIFVYMISQKSNYFNQDKQQSEQLFNQVHEFCNITENLLTRIENSIFLQEEEYLSIFRDSIITLLKIKELIRDTFTLSKIIEPENRIKYIQKNIYLSTYANSLQTKQLNLYWWSQILRLSSILINQINNSTQNNQVSRLLDPETLLKFEKLKTILDIFEYAVTFDQQDIFSFDRTHQKWNPLRIFLRYKSLDKPDHMRKEIIKLNKGLQTVTAIESGFLHTHSKFKERFVHGFQRFISLFSQEQRQRKSCEFKSKMQITQLKVFWNSTEEGPSKHFFQLLLEPIKFNQKIYIPRSSANLTQKSILKWIITDFSQSPPLESSQSIPQNKINIYQQDLMRIKMRVLCHKNFKRKSLKQYQMVEQFNSIVFHIHGGGFVALSSRFHQTYTRKWANNCKIPVLSIDYRKAPESPFPNALDDCWQAYNWIINESHNFFQIKSDKKIILVGDSSGGNLAIGVVNLCILNNIKLPDYLICFYPALNITLKTFTPSLLHSLQDPLLSFSFLKLCINAYVQNPKFDVSNNYFVSPLHTPQQLLKKYPPVKIIVGDQDPLFDDSLRFALKLQNNKILIETIIYENMIHGFLSLDIPGGLSSASICVKDSILLLKQLIEQLGSHRQQQ